ncbi:MAG: hypothetical protein ACI9MR_002592 [Myxococcota bacterium]|jgi:hypothetical protein
MKSIAFALTIALSPITLAMTLDTASLSDADAASHSAVMSTDYVCKGDRVERGSSTKYVIRRSGSDLRVEKGGMTVGRAVARNSKHFVEVGGSTKATIERDRILKAGSTWAMVSDAQRIYDCEPTVAATLWVLAQLGRL